MARRYSLAKRVRLDGDRDLAATYIPRAETLLGALVSRTLEQGRKFARQRFEENGVLYDLFFRGSSAEISITVQPKATQQPDLTLQLLWLPTGIVVYPAGDDSATGWGAPVVAPSGTQFDKAHTAPGIPHTSWTAGGKLGEVLLTPYKDANYPSVKRNAVPLFFEANEKPTTDDKNYAYTQRGSWASFRVEFDGFTQPTGAGGTVRQAVFHALNSGRQYLLPIRGYYDAAFVATKYVVTADFGGSPWLTDGALSSAPAGYKTALQRKRKDGVFETHAIESISRAGAFGTVIADLETECDLGGSTFDQPRTMLSIAIQNGAVALDAVERDQWIAYGNQSWYSSDAAVPVFSWAWPPGQLLNKNVSQGTTSGGAFVGLDQYVVTARGVDTPMFGKRVFANGRVFGECPDFVLSVGAFKTGTKYRVVAVTWRSSDNPPGTMVNHWEGQFNVFRVWFVDMELSHGVWRATEAPVGEFDETSNPHGWQPAGTFQKFGIGQVLPDFDTPQVYFTQLWKFDRTGTKMVAAVSALGLHGQNYSTIASGAVAGFPLIASLDTVERGSLSISQEPAEFHVPSTIDGFELETSGNFGAQVRSVDYDDDGALGMVFSAVATTVPYQDSEVETVTSMWFWMKGDVAKPLFFGEGVPGSAQWTDVATAYVFDAAYGAALCVQSTSNCGTLRTSPWQLRPQVYENGELLHQAVYDNPDHVASYTGDFNSAEYQLCIPVYARRLGERVIGYELEPKAGVRVISGDWSNCNDDPPLGDLGATRYLGSWFDFSAGDVAALVGVSTQLRLYPAGAV